MGAEIERRLGLQAQGSMVPFTVLDATGTPVGMTTYMNIEAAHKHVEIGSTWYARRVQRTPLNTECKLMLLRHAFEKLDAIAVEFRTHRLNAASRRAIERIGAKLDGILRNHQRGADGTLRDTACYSITMDEWPTIRAHLTFELTRARRRDHLVESQPAPVAPLQRGDQLAPESLAIVMRPGFSSRAIAWSYW
jgi:RimJ/RimL family protein N-acetyltransferase